MSSNFLHQNYWTYTSVASYVSFNLIGVKVPTVSTSYNHLDMRHLQRYTVKPYIHLVNFITQLNPVTAHLSACSTLF